MSDIAIRVEGLSKQYRIGGPQARYKTLRESVVSAAQAPLRRAGRLLRGEAATDHQETIWALKDVSFEVKHGEVLGIIGRNGAGKSTLLKILSRITAPTEGAVDLYGRVGSLLEVGTGFHPELTGRENIYLNGAILGMKRNEIERKFDEIVAFAELEKFLDTPVKHYSSGMYVRLAFAVAAHLDPEILLVDEVLAVGDAAFQKKCLGKMGEVASEGRTVLFVSHNMAAVRALCTRGVLLEDGFVFGWGHIDEIVDSYTRKAYQRAEQRSGSLPVFIHEHGIGIVQCTVELQPQDRGRVDLNVGLRIMSNRPVRNIGVGLSISTSDGARLSLIAPSMTGFVIERLEGDCQCVFRCADIGSYLAGGDYLLGIWLAKPRIAYIVQIPEMAVFSVPPRDLYSIGEYFLAQRHGPVPLPFEFSVLPHAPESADSEMCTL